MRRSAPISLLTVTVFILLETVSAYMVIESGIVQNNAVVSSLRVFGDYVEDKWAGVRYWFSLKEVNSALMEENALLMEENTALLNRLEAAGCPVDTVERQYELIPAMVISNSVSRLHNYLILDKGESDGLKTDMGVITSDGLVGYIVAVTGHYSRVASVLDIDTKFSVILKGSGTFGSMSWNGIDAGRLTVSDVPVHTIVAEGDTVLSSGFSACFPPFIPIGTVAETHLNDGINYELVVDMFEDIRALKYVYVVDFAGKDEMMSLREGNR